MNFLSLDGKMISMAYQNASNKTDLKKGGQKVKNQGNEDKLDGASTAVDGFANSAGSSIEMIGEIEGEHVVKYRHTNLSN